MHYTPIVGSGGQWLASMYDSQNAPSALLQARKDLWNGNILTQDRWDEMGVLFEDLEYQYNWLDDELIQNRLYHVNDLIAGSPQEGDIEDQGTFCDAQNQIKTDNNYLYTAIGEMQVDKSEDIEEIVWRVDSKIAEVRRKSNSTRKNLRFDYDAMGNRIAKHIYTDNQFTDWERSTYYVRDASGNVMAVYDREATGQEPPSTFRVSERHIYGSSRLGMDVTTYDFISTTYTITNETTRELGHKQYEISNHLGNVLSVITDQKLPVVDATVVVSYSAVVVTATDYSPFGVGLYGRSWSGEYRYGFMKYEIERSYSDTQTAYSSHFRSYCSNLGRWFSLDPKLAKYPDSSPYNSFINNPILFIDILGDT
ncbi:MAG: hypothetical protein ACK57W_10680, partial [Flavobacteriales bacterium]